MFADLLLPKLDMSPAARPRLYGRLLLAVLLPVLGVHALLLLGGGVSPLALAIEAVLAAVAWYIARSGITGRKGPPPVGRVLGACGLLQILAAFETGGVGSPMLVLLVMTVVFAGLQLDARRLTWLTGTLIAAYGAFAFVLPNGFSPVGIDGALNHLSAGRRIPLAAVTATIQNAIFLIVAAGVAHGVSSDLGRRWSTMRRESRQDALTRIPNRLGFIEKVRSAIGDERSISWPVSVLLLDLDHFKLVNDKHGHHMGDEVLKHTAQLLRQSAGPMDHVGRLGGEEFAIAAFGADPDHGADLASRIVRRFRMYDWTRLHRDLKVRCSIGVAALAAGDGRADPAGTLDRLLQDADDALYAVQENGRDSYQVAKPNVPLAATPHPTTRRV